MIRNIFLLALLSQSLYAGELKPPPNPANLSQDLNAAGNDITNVGALDVDGDTTLNGNASLGDAAADTIDVNASTITVTATPDALNIATHTATAGDKIMSWDGTNRRVGVGNSRPAATLSVHNTAEAALNCTANGLIVGQGDGTSNHLLLGAQSIQAKQNCTTADVLKVNVGGGSVGIGTGSPGAILHTYGAGSVFNKVESSNGEAGLILGRSAVQLWHLGTNNAGISGNASHFSLTSTYGISPLLTATTEYTVGVNISSPTARLHVHNGDIRLSTDTGTRGIYFPSGQQQVDSGQHMLSQTNVAVATGVITFTGLNSVEDKGYILEVFGKNNSGGAVTYSIEIGTYTTATDYNGERLIQANGVTQVDSTGNNFAIAGATTQDMGAEINVIHIGERAMFVSESLDGAVADFRAVGFRSAVEKPVVIVQSITLKTDVNAGFGVGSAARIYSKR